MSSEIRKITLIDSNGQRESAIEIRYLSDNTELVVVTPTERFEAEADDAFSALQLLRQAMRRRGVDVFCYGASKNVFPSAMSRVSTKAYKTFLGQPGRIEDIVDIFDGGPDIEIASVEEQDAFHTQWFESLCKNEPTAEPST